MKKAIKISKFLENEDIKYICTASYGHIIDLKQKEMSINFDTWEGIYENTNIKAIKTIKDLSKKCEYVLLAADDDDEGHFIAKSVSDIIDKKIKKYRIIFHEITKSAVLKAIENKHDINMNRVKCQIGRRLADRIFGYKLSPLLWNYFNENKLSVGRCQSPILAYIVKRTSEVNNPTPIVCYKIKADFENNLLNTIYDNETINVIDNINFKRSYNVSFKISEAVQKPPPPYITSTIQMDCSSIFNLPSKKCMDVLQKLYENGDITYHRTSSFTISNLFKNQAKTYIVNAYGENFSKPNNYNFKEGAHECIRIVNINKFALDEDNIENKIYKLIWKRTVCSQLSPALYDQYNITLQYKTDIFKTVKKLLKFPGFLIIDKKEVAKESLTLPEKTKMIKLYTEASVTKLTLYNDNTIIKQMEDSGIGRPSTFATIVSTLFSKNYIEYCSNPIKKIKAIEYFKTCMDKIDEKEVELDLYVKGNTKMICHTDIGKNIIQYLNEFAPYIINEETTKIMETQIDLVAEGKSDYKAMLNSFNKTIDKSILEAPVKNNDNEVDKLIKTKFGNCILTKDKKFINYDGYLTQFKKTKLTTKDIEFLVKLPIQYNSKNIVIGRYGIYLKDETKNIALTQVEIKDIVKKYNL
jgi:DNA topoisomerase-1